MTPRRVLFATACLVLTGVLSTGCTGVLEPRGNGEGGPDAGAPADAGGQPATPQALFNATVRGHLGSKCIPCHVDGTGSNSPYFLAPTADEYYNFLMTGYPNEWIGTTPEDSIIYTKGLDPHAGNIQWDATEQQDLIDWINAEYVDYTGGGGGNPVPDPDAANCAGDPTQCALENFARCFNYTDWGDKQLYSIATLQSQSGTCQACHADGTGGFYANGDSLTTYRKWKEVAYVGSLVKGAADAGGNFAGLVPSNVIVDKGTDATHPLYTLDPTYEGYLNEFVQSTLAAFGTGGCIDDPGQ